MTGIEPFLLAASTVMGVVGSITQANAANDAAKYNAAVNQQNARIAEQQAASAAEQQRITNYRKLGAIKAGYGASGVTNDGSPMDVLMDSFTQGEYDVQNIIYEGKIRSAGYQNNASLDIAAGKNAKKSGYINAASGALLGGAKTVKSFDDAGYFD